MSESRQPLPQSGGQGAPSRALPGRLARLALKEMRETLRDRRTIVTLILMPVLVYPLLGVAFQKFLLTSLKPRDETIFWIAVESEEDRAIVRELLAHGETEWKRRRNRLAADGRRRATGKTPEGDEETPPKITPEDLKNVGKRWQFDVKVADDLDRDVAAGTYDVGIRFTAKQTDPINLKRLSSQDPIPLEIVHREGAPLSERALKYTQRCLDAFNDRVRDMELQAEFKRLRTRHRELRALQTPAPDGPLRPYQKELRPRGTGSQLSMAALIPLILILMTITGAVYPAIDLTAGERERGTLEMLVAAPIPRMGLLLAKYVTVLAVAVLTATVNLVSMTLTVLATGLGPLLFGEGGLSLAVVGQIFGLLILFAMFFSAILLAVTSFARSFKEAQAYLIPLMLVSIAPGVFSMMPDLKLDGILVVTPLANIVLLARDLLQGSADPVTTVAVVVSTLMYALAAIMAAARIFGTDAILYGSSGTWTELFRRPEQRAAACSPMAAVLVVAVSFPLCFLSRQFAGRSFSESPSALLTASGLITVVVFAGLPVAVMAFRKVQLGRALALRGSSPSAFLAAGLLGLSLWPFIFEMLLGIERLGLVSFQSSLAAQAEALVRRLQSVSPLLVYASLAIIPAVCEELFFRGMLLSALRSRITARQAVVVSAVAFAVFHVIVLETLAVERFFPSLLLGLVLGWVCVRTGSLFPGILLHAANNGLLLSLALFQNELQAWGVGTEEQRHLPWWLLLTAAATAALGFGLLALATKDGRNSESVGSREEMDTPEPAAVEPPAS